MAEPDWPAVLQGACQLKSGWFAIRAALKRSDPESLEDLICGRDRHRVIRIEGHGAPDNAFVSPKTEAQLYGLSLDAAMGSDRNPSGSQLKHDLTKGATDQRDSRPCKLPGIDNLDLMNMA
jgi:hypothetical protein